MRGPLVEVLETYYGEGEVRGAKTYLLCLLEPGAFVKQPRHWLVVDARVPVIGSMVVQTTRHARRNKNGTCRRGLPERVVRISYDPDPNPPGVWRGNMTGKWAVRRVLIHRRTSWQRLKHL